ncbi:MAG: DUF5615 family PIN-like protein [Candidatus Hodarchaeales archaeon]
MELIVDECLNMSTVFLLRKWGFETISIAEVLHWGAGDEDIFKIASARNIPIITHDRRFGKIYFDSIEKPPTVIVLQVQSPHPEATNNLLIHAFKKINLTHSKYSEKLIIISRKRIRIRTKRIL